MISKKKTKADLDKRRNTFFLLGLISALSLIYAGFELYATNSKVKFASEIMDDTPLIANIDTKSTDQKNEIKKVQPIVSQKLTIVDNKSEIEKLFKGWDDEYEFPKEIFDDVEIVDPPTEIIIDFFNFSEKMPEFPGGSDAFNNYLSQQLKYPEICIKLGIEGTVNISFIIEKDGSLSKIEVLNSIYPDLDQEAIRVLLKSPRWIPGENQGKKVRVKYSLPIKFVLSK
jgi:periplasmic protein TonB